MKEDPTGGVKIINIAGRMARERERLIGMTDEERAWRAKFLKNQALAPEEPITPKGYYKELYNPFRRFYQWPLNKVEHAISPVVGATAASVIRILTGRLLMCIAGVYGAWYYLHYNTRTWERKSGWKVIKSREIIFPGDERFPNYPVKKANEYATLGFEKSKI